MKKEEIIEKAKKILERKFREQAKMHRRYDGVEPDIGVNVQDYIEKNIDLNSVFCRANRNVLFT